MLANASTKPRKSREAAAKPRLWRTRIAKQATWPIETDTDPITSWTDTVENGYGKVEMWTVIRHCRDGRWTACVRASPTSDRPNLPRHESDDEMHRTASERKGSCVAMMLQRPCSSDPSLVHRSKTRTSIRPSSLPSFQQRSGVLRRGTIRLVCTPPGMRNTAPLCSLQIAQAVPRIPGLAKRIPRPRENILSCLAHLGRVHSKRTSDRTREYSLVRRRRRRARVRGDVGSAYRFGEGGGLGQEIRMDVRGRCLAERFERNGRRTTTW